MSCITVRSLLSIDWSRVFPTTADESYGGSIIGAINVAQGFLMDETNQGAFDSYIDLSSCHIAQAIKDLSH
jgi:hypothetical protein